MVDAGAGDEPAWLALGLDLALLGEGGRTTPLDLSVPFSYRPGWGLPWMVGTEQAGAPVLCGAPVTFRPGDHGRVVVMPPYPAVLEAWHRVGPGDRLALLEGPRAVGTGVVRWTRRTGSYAALGDAPPEAMVRWAQGGPEPA